MAKLVPQVSEEDMVKILNTYIIMNTEAKRLYGGVIGGAILMAHEFGYSVKWVLNNMEKWSNWGYKPGNAVYMTPEEVYNSFRLHKEQIPPGLEGFFKRRWRDIDD